MIQNVYVEGCEAKSDDFSPLETPERLSALLRARFFAAARDRCG
jgi:hypothetical protein